MAYWRERLRRSVEGWYPGFPHDPHGPPTPGLTAPVRSLVEVRRWTYWSQDLDVIAMLLGSSALLTAFLPEDPPWFRWVDWVLTGLALAVIMSGLYIRRRRP